jgi:hypothetical protein
MYARHRPPGGLPLVEATVNDSRERQFSVSDGQQTYTVHATQTHRPQPFSLAPALEWQFYIETLDLILVQDGKRYVSIDDPNRVFTVLETVGASREMAHSSRDREAG